jgi:hypothetical protein
MIIALLVMVWFACGLIAFFGLSAHLKAEYSSDDWLNVLVWTAIIFVHSLLGGPGALFVAAVATERFKHGFNPKGRTK